jgi:hypothetical protein
MVSNWAMTRVPVHPGNNFSVSLWGLLCAMHPILSHDIIVTSETYLICLYNINSLKYRLSYWMRTYPSEIKWDHILTIYVEKCWNTLPDYINKNIYIYTYIYLYIYIYPEKWWKKELQPAKQDQEVFFVTGIGYLIKPWRMPPSNAILVVKNGLPFIVAYISEFPINYEGCKPPIS